MKTIITTTTITIKYGELRQLMAAIATQFDSTKKDCYTAALEGQREIYFMNLNALKETFNLVKIFGPIIWNDEEKTLNYWINSYKKKIEYAEKLDLQCFLRSLK